VDFIPLTRVKARLSGIISRLIYRKETAVITRHGRPVAALVPYEEWQKARAGAGDAVEGLAGLPKVPDGTDELIDRMVESIYLERARAKGRKAAF
jgi:prevent-host-death family protein